MEKLTFFSLHTTITNNKLINNRNNYYPKIKIKIYIYILNKSKKLYSHKFFKKYTMKTKKNINTRNTYVYKRV